jgi:hypothetical protein
MLYYLYRKEIPQVQIAQQLGINESSVSQWTGNTGLSPAHLATLGTFYPDAVEGPALQTERKIVGVIAAMHFVQTIIPGNADLPPLTREDFAWLRHLAVSTHLDRPNVRRGLRDLEAAVTSELAVINLRPRVPVQSLERYLDQLRQDWNLPYLITYAALKDTRCPLFD